MFLGKLFSGYKNKLVKGVPVYSEPCNNCSTQSFESFGIIRYFHIFWIPTFVTSKKICLECTDCQERVEDSDIPEQVKQKIRPAVFKFTEIFPLFIGSIMQLIFIFFIINAVELVNKQHDEYITQPKISDIYVVTFHDVFSSDDPRYKFGHGVMRIKSIHSNEIEFQISKTAYISLENVHKEINQKQVLLDSYYEGESYVVDKEQMQGIKKKWGIYSIRRLKNNP